MSADEKDSNATEEPEITNTKRNDKDELLLEFVKRRYDGEWQRTRDLDSKAGSLIGCVTIVTGVVIGLGTFSILEKLSEPLYYIPFFLGLASLLFSIIMSLIAIKIRSWYFSPAIEYLEKFSRDVTLDYKAVATQLLYFISQAVRENFGYNQFKGKFISVSWISLVVGIGALVVYAGIFAAFAKPSPQEVKITVQGNATAIQQMIELIGSIADVSAKMVTSQSQLLSYFGKDIGSLLILS